MIPNKLIQTAVFIVLLFAATGQLSRLIQFSRIQTLKVLQDSQSTKWGKVWLPPEQKRKH
ncbi:MAG: hypothetical protein K2Q26_06215 [Bdellovibrionales bacterium]|nr:hypothetical protein [Bdellovibrionales bacterium]